MVLKVEKVKKNIPGLRFPGFEVEWEEKRLGEVADVPMYGMNAAATKFDGQNIYLRITDIDDAGHLSRESLTSPAADLEVQYQVKSGDLLFARTGASVGRNYLYREEDGQLYFAGFLIKFPIEKALPFFVYLSMQQERYRKWVNAVSMRSGQPGINAKEYSAYRFSLPQIDEQKKISDFLGTVDEWIENLQARKVKWEEYKKGMMQKIFPGGAGQAAEIRFKDENGNEFPEWEEKKLGEVTEVVGGGTPDTTVKDFWGGDIIWFTPTEIKQKYLSQSERTITSEGVARSSATILPVGTVLLTTRATIGDVGIAVVECATNQGFQSFIVHDDQASEFWYYWLIQNKKEFVRRANGSTFSEISGTEIRKIKTLVPSLREQQKIAALLTAVDEMIHSHQQKITRAEEWKKGLMQRMFV